MLDQHHHYMKLALQQAQIRRGFCAPNPAVGAVVVKNNQIVSEGTHWACGHPHAEVDALSKIDLAAAQGAVLYVTLEPCCHHGRTPPCTQLLIQRGISQVFYGLQDVNPIIRGQGAQRLRDAGIDCQHIELPEINEFYRSYVYWWRHKKPHVSVKIAISLDNQYASADGKPMQITGKKCRQYTHVRRQQADAILTTCQTILCDDPQLNVRVNQETIAKPIYVLDSKLQLPLTARILQTSKKTTVFHAVSAVEERVVTLKNNNIRCVAVAESKFKLELEPILDLIGEDGVQDLWVEAGGACFHAFVKFGLADEIIIYQSNTALSSQGKTLAGFSLHDYVLINQFLLDNDTVFIYRSVV